MARTAMENDMDTHAICCDVWYQSNFMDFKRFSFSFFFCSLLRFKFAKYVEHSPYRHCRHNVNSFLCVASFRHKICNSMTLFATFNSRLFIVLFFFFLREKENDFSVFVVVIVALRSISALNACHIVTKQNEAKQHTTEKLLSGKLSRVKLQLCVIYIVHYSL